MFDSRSIYKFLKSNNEKKVSLETLDRITPNTFELTQNGRLESSVFGAFSNITFRIQVFQNRNFSSLEFPVTPNRISLLSKKILQGNKDYFLKKSNLLPELNLIGFVNKSIYTAAPVGENRYKASYLNIYLYDEENYAVNISYGTAELIKDELNRNDLKDYKQINHLAILVPIDDMELLMDTTGEYVNSYRTGMLPFMLEGRSLYEDRCKTIFKDVKGDPKKIRKVEEEFFKLSKLEQQDIESGRKTLPKIQE